jgi:hypothetical protein
MCPWLSPKAPWLFVSESFTNGAGLLSCDKILPSAYQPFECPPLTIHTLYYALVTFLKMALSKCEVHCQQPVLPCSSNWSMIPKEILGILLLSEPRTTFLLYTFIIKLSTEVSIKSLLPFKHLWRWTHPCMVEAILTYRLDGILKYSWKSPVCELGANQHHSGILAFCVF